MQGFIPDSYGMMALAIVMLNVCTILIILRLIGRRQQKLRIGADDVFVMLSWLGLVGICVNMIVAVAFRRWGRPLQLLARSPDSPEDIVIGPSYLESVKFQLAHELMLPLQLMFAKLSILFFYRRLLCIESRGFLHWATLLTAVATGLWGLSMFFLFLFQCGPDVSKYWSPDIQVHMDQCLDVWIEALMASSDCFLDLVILVLPIRRLVTLNISLRKKILVTGVFATGLLSLFASVIRIYAYVAPLDRSNTAFTYTNTNLVISMTMFWGLFEAGFAVIAACLPSTKFFLDLAIMRLTGRQQSRAYGKTYGSGRSTSKASATPPDSPRSPRSFAGSSRASDDLEKGDTVAEAVTH